MYKNETEEEAWTPLPILRHFLRELPDLILGFVRLIVLFSLLATSLIEIGFEPKVPSGSDPITLLLLLFVGYLLLTVIDRFRQSLRRVTFREKKEK